MKKFDLLVIGSGPGGYIAAIRGAQNGLKVAIVERDVKLGGTCLLRGCIPTKSLLHSADLLTKIRGASEHGINIEGKVSFDFAVVQKAREKQVTKGAQGVAYLMKKNKIEILSGHGTLKGPNTVEVRSAATAETVSADYIVLATGSRPRHIPGLTIDGTHILTSDEALELKTPPASMLILGAGAVGVEFASVYSRFGTKCTIVEMQPHLVPVEDVEVSQEFEKAYKKRGISVKTSTKFIAAKVRGNVVCVELEKDGKTETIDVEKVLVAIGRAPVTDSLGLEAVGITCDRGGFVEVDAFMKTACPTIFAIGDVIRTPWLAHVASAEGILAADQAAKKEVRPLKYAHTPGCTYASPEIGSVGLTERAAHEQGYDVVVGKFPFSAIPKARILGETEGFVKIVSEKRYHEVLGVHIIGPHATDLIAEASVALSLEATVEDIANTIHAHPTLAEGMLEAAHATLGHALHL